MAVGQVRLRGHGRADFPSLELRAFRAELHACCTRRADALLELTDALLCAPAVPLVAHLSLEPAHQRGWGSAYAALARARIDAEQVRDLMGRYPLDGGPPADLRDRCHLLGALRRQLQPAARPVLPPLAALGRAADRAGWSFQWIAQLSFACDSRTAPVDACRLHPLDNHNQVAVASSARCCNAYRPAV